jgi:hypothetical protein
LDFPALKNLINGNHVSGKQDRNPIFKTFSFKKEETFLKSLVRIPGNSLNKTKQRKSSFSFSENKGLTHSGCSPYHALQQDSHRQGGWAQLGLGSSSKLGRAAHSTPMPMPQGVLVSWDGRKLTGEARLALWICSARGRSTKP